MLTDTEIDTLKRIAKRLEELEDACVHYEARETQLIDMLQRIEVIVAEEDEEYAV